jgi:outer membrane protein assembly factor BamB
MLRAMLRFTRVLAVSAAVCGVVPFLLAAPMQVRADANWPQWRGPNGLGLADGTDYPEEWGPDKNVAWKAAVPGRGLSSPVVWGDRVFITTSIEGAQVPGRTAPEHLDFERKPGYLHPDSVGVDYKHTLKVLAFDTRSGKMLWERTAYDGLMYDNRHRRNTYASPSVVTDGQLVYAFFEAAGLYAYDMSGKLVWKRAPELKNGTFIWEKSLGPIAKAGLGPGTSPILFENTLILQIDQEMGAGSGILALDKRTGAEVWRTDRTTRRSWATPLLVRTPERMELIASGAEVVISYDPKTGKELWRSRGMQSHPIPSPVAGHGLVFLTAGSGAKRTIAFKPGANGDVTATNVVWAYDKGAPYVPSPLLVGKYLYIMNERGLTTCFDAVTGEVKYEGGRPPGPATFMASMVAFGERILQMSEDGDTYVLKAGPVHEVLRTNSIGEPIYASPALAGGTIYIRGEQNLYAIRQGAVSSSPPARR